MTESLTLKKEQNVIDLSKLTEEERERAAAMARQIDIQDSQAVVTFGVAAQKEIADFSDSVLNQVRSKDTGYVGEVLSSLVSSVKELDVDSLSEGGSFWSKIPLIGALVDRFQQFITRYQKLSTQIESIVTELDKARMQLLKDITLLDNMYGKNLSYLKDMEVIIAAGQIKLKELREDTLPGFHARVEESGDPVEIQKFHDLEQFVDRFDKKLHDLMLSRMVAIQSAPQLRMIQNSDQLLVEKIQSSILNTIPLWKNQIVIAITLMRQKKALELQKKVSDTTNELLKKNAELLKESATGIARESERGIVDLETLKEVNDDLISTIEETLSIQAEGRTRRRQAETELARIESDLKDRLVSLKNR